MKVTPQRSGLDSVDRVRRSEPRDDVRRRVDCDRRPRVVDRLRAAEICDEGAVDPVGCEREEVLRCDRFTSSRVNGA